jgi:hypothetical protein
MRVTIVWALPIRKLICKLRGHKPKKSRVYKGIYGYPDYTEYICGRCGMSYIEFINNKNDSIHV